MKLAWIIMCISFQQPTGPARTILMQDGHVYASKRVCERSDGLPDLIRHHERFDSITGDKTECACVSEKIVRR